MKNIPSFNSLELLRSVAGISAYRERLSSRFGASKLPENIAILGAAEEGQRLVEICVELGIHIELIIDDAPERVGKKIGPVQVKPSSELEALNRDTLVIIASHRTTGATARLREQGFARVFPFMVLQQLFPEQFPPHMFYEGLLESIVSSRSRILKLCDRFKDDHSIRVLERALSYRILGDPSVFDGYIERGLYTDGSVVEFTADEVYVDCGAFDGDSVSWFRDVTSNNFDRIVAFEPDIVTFGRLQKNFDEDGRIECVNSGVYSTTTTLKFSAAGTRGAAFTDDPEAIHVPVTSIDDFLNGERATYIKMNIEGAEIDALWGAKNTLERWQPKLAVSVYHRPHDLWEIPELVSRLLPAHDLYLRQHDGGIIETVLYAVPTSS